MVLIGLYFVETDPTEVACGLFQMKKTNSYNLLILCAAEVRFLKEYKCVQVSHHDKIGKVCEEYQMEGWHLHTYQAQGSPTLVNHYLLFERG